MGFSLSLLLVLSSLSPADSWVTLSRHSTQVAFHAILDDVSGRLMTTGVLFRSAFKDITLRGSSDTDCYIAVGDARGFDRGLFESPQLCTHFGIFPPGDTTTSQGASSMSRGISLGIDVDQATVAIVDFEGEYGDLTRKNIVNIPGQSFPVAVHSDAQGGVYIGMHETGGLRPPAAPTDENDELKDIYNYYQLMTHPSKTTHFTTPHAFKVNPMTQEILWQVDFETTDGRSTIGGVQHLPDRDILLVAGSSSGKGSYVGAGEWSNSWDGFITLINATSGLIDDSAANQTYLASEHSLRVQSQVGQDEYILGVCSSDDDVYVTGSTTGKMKPDATEDGGAFLIKLDVDTLNILWVQQWYGLGTEGIKCTASSTDIYVAGHVPKGVSLKADTTRLQQPSNDQDLFLSLVDAKDGSVQWTRQFDSRKPDHLAGISRMSTGDLIVMGNSMDFDRGVSDIYVASVSLADGFYDWQGLPPDADPIRGDMTPDSDATFPPGMFDPDKGYGNSQENENQTTIIVVATVVPVLVFVIIALFTARKRSTSQSAREEASPEAKNNKTTQETSGSSEMHLSVSGGGVV